jgi:hypothetical protein
MDEKSATAARKNSVLAANFLAAANWINDHLDGSNGRRYQRAQELAAANWINDHLDIGQIITTFTVSAFSGAPIEINLFPGSETNLRAALRIIGGTWEKRSSDSLMIFRQEYAGFYVDLNISRERVCERIVIDRVEVPEQLIPAHVEEKVEWRCKPILPEETAASLE